MLQLHISKSLTPDLKSHMCDSSDNPGAMQWYAHRVHVLRRKCVIVMERESRYAILFNGLTRPDFARFPELLRGRLFREVLSICHLQNDQAARIAALVDLVTDPVEVMPGNDRSVQSHINQVVFEFDWMAQEIGALPESEDQEFNFGLRINQTPRKRKGDRNYFIPMEVFQGFWSGLLEHMAVSHNDQIFH